MTTPESERRARRAEWRRYRENLGVSESVSAEQFARRGLAAHADPLDLRIVVLPADPNATDVVPLDTETDAWLSEHRPSPYDGRPVEFGHTTRATSHALVRASWYRDDQLWNRYLAIHRHGGVETGDAQATWEPRGRRTFALRPIVAAVWSALAIQVEAAKRWQVAGPWEFTVALRNADGAALGDFAEGWAAVGEFGRESALCIEPTVVHRWEIDEIVPEELALDVGNRLENSFGTTLRRHLANRGELNGRFDYRS